MKSSLVALLFGFALASTAHAQVFANPGFQNLGTASVGQRLTTTVTFMNQSQNTIQGVNASCTGGFGGFSCFSFCNMLMPFSSCTVQVSFSPMRNDGAMQSLNINLTGPGVFASATVYGTDAMPTPAPDELDSETDSDALTKESF